MGVSEYKIESAQQILGPLLAPRGDRRLRLTDRALAVAVAAKCYTAPYGHEIRVVHVDTGEIVFRKTATRQEDTLEN